ncbi:MAG TPA: hydrogenase iron-sulfur subunit [Deltaproteobacteria bacterium]|nr:hydrogenase iron-sulfur subunit [Deltaproteobacteria bacterium]
MFDQILFFGGGDCGRRIVENLLKDGKAVIVATTSDGDEFRDANGIVELITHTRISHCSGTFGNFQVALTCNGDEIHRTVGSIVLSEAHDRKSNFSLYGLKERQKLFTLTELNDRLRLNDPSISSGKKIVILTGLADESNPVTWKASLRAAMVMQSEHKAQIYILAGNLKVSGSGLEALTRDAKKAGVVIIKFTDALPHIDQNEKAGITVTYTDEITRQPFSINPDIVVVDETLKPAEYFRDLAQLLELDTDHAGYLQSDNVHRLNVRTNRRGILAAGPSRGILDSSQEMADAAAAVVELKSQFSHRSHKTLLKAEIDPGKCIRCLTCFRLCPYGALELGPKVTVSEEACEGCGICTAECPRGAVGIEGLKKEKIMDSIGKTAPALFPHITAYCCNRSAVIAGDTAACLGNVLLEHFDVIPVPCAGSVSMDLLLSAYAGGADGVLILTCHEGNCHSEHGNHHARNRADRLSMLLEDIGLEADRIRVHTIAANMAVEYTNIVREFEDRIRELGPSPLK